MRINSGLCKSLVGRNDMVGVGSVGIYIYIYTYVLHTYIDGMGMDCWSVPMEMYDKYKKSRNLYYPNFYFMIVNITEY